MQTRRVLAGLILAFLINTATPAEVPVQILERGPHHRVTQHTVQQTLPNGAIVERTVQQVELATGMHYRDGENWLETRELIEPHPDGAVAQFGPHKAAFSANLNSQGAIQLVDSDGNRFTSHILGLAYTDASSGNSVLIGTTKNCVGQILPPNQIVYTNAFNEFLADVRYTYTRNGFEQDIILRQRLPSLPSDHGMNPATTRLEVFTEFIESPVGFATRTVLREETDPERRGQMAIPDFVDETMNFGGLGIAKGRAVDFQGVVTDEIPVGKTWEIREGRTFLIESVELPSVQNALNALPAGQVRADAGTIRTKAKLPPQKQAVVRPFPTAPKQRAAADRKPMRLMASLDLKNGVLLDYVATLLPGETNYTFRPEATHHITGPVNLYGTSTIVGGTVIKFARESSNPSLSFNGTVVCDTTPYRPAIFTAVDDSSVGTTLTNKAITNYYAVAALRASTTVTGELHDLRFLYANTAIDWNGSTQRFYNLQFINCSNAIVRTSAGNNEVHNILATNVLNLFSGSATRINAQHVTANSVGTLSRLTGSPATVTLTNSILVNVTNLGSGTITGDYLGTNGTPFITGVSHGVIASSPAFLTAAGGHHYLATNSTLRDAGTTNIATNILAELRLATVSAPLFLTNTITTDNVLSLASLRDTNSLDLGYHYAPLDYIASGCNISGATVLLTNGAAVGIHNGSAGAGFQFNGGTLLSVGTPSAMNRIVRAYCVQENSGGLGAWMFNDNVGAGGNNTSRFRFTEFTSVSEDGGTLWSGEFWTAWEWSHCILHNLSVYITAAQDGSTYGITNNTFEWADATFTRDGFSSVFHLRNNLFRRHNLNLGDGNASWTVRDNLFDTQILADWGNSVVRSHNTYYDISTNNQWNCGTDAIFLTNVTYQTGLLSRYYQPSGSSLINAGSQNATNAGLYHFTTTTNQVKEADSQVDIGPHFVALNNQGLPYDSDGDGPADYMEDVNGNGIVDIGETPFAPVVVTLTLPTNGSVYYATSTITLSASASILGSSITNVEFFDGTTSLGQDSTFPYSITWINPPGGIRSLTARAMSAVGVLGTSSPPVTNIVYDALLVFGGASNPSASDTNVLYRLWTNGFYPVLKKDSDAVSSDADGKRLVVISASVSSTSVGTKFTSNSVPTICWEEALLDDLQMTTSGHNVTNGPTSLVMTATNHPMAAGLSGTVTVVTSAGSFSWGTPNSNAVRVAILGGDTNQVGIFGYESNALMFTLDAPARRAGFFLGDALSSTLNSNGWRLFDYAIQWVTGTNSPPALVDWDTPTNSSIYIASTNITLTAKAIDNDSGISKVVFYRDKVRIGTSYTSLSDIYSLTWSNAPAGTYRMTAKGIDQGRLLSLTSTQDVTLIIRSNVLFVAGSTTLDSCENALSNRLASRGYLVTVKAAATSTTADADGKTVVLISSSAAAANVTNRFTRTVTPVIVWQQDLFDDMGFTGTNNTNFGLSASQTDLVIQNSSHPLAAGLFGTVTVVSNASSFSWGQPGSNALRIATIVGDTNKVAIFGYEHGSLLAGIFGTNGTHTNALAAPGRRVGFFFGTNAACSLTNAGLALFDAAIDWAVAKPCHPTLDVMLVLDTSGSVVGKPFADEKAAGSNFISDLQPGDKVGLVSFAATSQVQRTVITNFSLVASNLYALTNGQGTRLDYAISMAQSELEGTNRNPASIPVMLLFTDGAQYPTNTINLAIQAADAAKAKGTRLITIRFAGDPDGGLMQALASPGDFYFAPDTSELSDIYNAIASSLCRSIPPAIEITSPVSGTVSNAPIDVRIVASASDEDGAISQVQFFSGTNLLGTVASTPYSIIWTNPAVGIYTLTAVVTDNSGLSATSTPPVVFTMNEVPSVNAGSDQILIWPANQVTLNGTATDDGRPTNGTFVTAWSLVPGQGSVTFGDSNALSTSAAFSTNGIYVLRLTANDGAASSYEDMTVTILRRPFVSITNPPDGAISNAPTNIQIAATASDLDGSVTNISFYAGADLLAMDASFPYSIVWAYPAAGIYALTAVAMDDSGLTSTSSVVSISVRQAPTITIITPTAGQTFDALANMAFSSVAEDVDGFVTNVTYFTNGVKFGEAVNSPYRLPWNNVLGNPPGGNYTIVARATDNHGLTNDSLPVVFSVERQVPTVAYLNPLSNAGFAFGEPILIQADAGDTDGTVTNVQFYADTNFTVLLAEVTNAPYSFVWTTPASGTHLLRARVYDNDGLTGTSAVLPITVQSCTVRPALISFSFNTNTILGGSTLTGTVTLASGALPGGQPISFLCTNATVLFPSSILVPEGATNLQVLFHTTPVGVTNIASIIAFAAPTNSLTNVVTIGPGGAILDSGTNQSAGLVTTNLTAMTTNDLVRLIVGPEVVFGNVTYTGNRTQAGFFMGGSGIVGFESGLILSSGRIEDVVGPNINKPQWYTFGPGPGDTNLSSLATNTTRDAAVLEFDFIPVGEFVTWDYVFASEEYNEWVGSQYNDVFAFFLNGVNVALLPDGITPVSVNNVNGGNTNSHVPSVVLPTNSQFYRDNADGSVGGTTNTPFNTEMDGLTTVLRINAQVRPGVVNHIKLAIADAGINDSSPDEFNDAVVMIRAGSFRTGGNVVYTRDDGTQSEYSHVKVASTNRLVASTENATFDLKSIVGTLSAARVERVGQIQFSLGDRFDLQLGGRFTGTNDVDSFGPAFANFQTSTTPFPYHLEWPLPKDAFPAVEAVFGSTLNLPWVDQISGLCGSNHAVTDLPQAAWPTNKNILTLLVSGRRDIAQGRCQDLVLSGTNAPANGQWDILLNGYLIASAGIPKGWSVEPDYTVYHGYNVCAPTDALASPAYELRVKTGQGNQSGVFAVVPAGSRNGAPVLLPLEISPLTVTSQASLTLTVTLDAPAPSQGAYVTLVSDGLSNTNVPAYVVIPSGERSVSTSFTQGTGTTGMVKMLASFNGYRRTSLFVTNAPGTVPGTPISLVASHSSGRVILDWNAVTGATGYNVNRSNSLSAVWERIYSDLPTNHFVDVNVFGGVTYWYTVSATNRWGASVESSAVSIFVPYQGPVAAPWIVPFGGIFNDSVDVLLTNVYAGSRIFYTTNGTFPTTNSPSFITSGTVTLGSNAIISAYSTNSSFVQQSPIVSASFSVVSPTIISCNSTVTNVLAVTNSFSKVQGPGYYTFRYAFTANKGDLITILASSVDFDAVLFLIAQGTNLVAANDDAGANNTDSRIVFDVREGGPLLIEVTSFWPEDLGKFALSLTCQQVAELNVLTNAYPTVTTNSAFLPNLALIDFGITNASSTITRHFTITNSGNTNLILSDIAILPEQSHFSVTNSSLTIPPNGVTNLSVALYSDVGGSFGSYLTFTSNDATNEANVPENPFYVLLKGQIRVPPANPAVLIYFPTNGTVIPYVPSLIEIDATASDADGIKQVEFFTNGVSLGASAILTNPPYSFIWSNGVTNGNFALTARATDNSNNVSTSSTNLITVGVPVLTLAPTTNNCAMLTNWTRTLWVTNRDVTGTPLANSNVTFFVFGANNYIANRTTDVAGVAGFTYTGTNYGADFVIVASLWNGILVLSTNEGLFDWAKPLSCGEVVQGSLTEYDGFYYGCACAFPSHYTDFYNFTANAGEVKLIRMLSTNFSTLFVITDTNCRPLATNLFLNATDSQIIFTAPSNGTYIIQATAEDAYQTGEYSILFDCGLPSNAPDMGVLLNGTNLASGALWDFGTTLVGAPVTNTVTITNRGTGNLNVSSLKWFTNYYDVLSVPFGPIGTNSSTNLTIRFTAQTSGVHTNLVTLSNNTANANPFVIRITAIANPSGNAPTVALVEPTENASFLFPSVVTLTAAATASSPATVSRVDFFVNGTFVGMRTNAPYSVAWHTPGVGTYTVVASALDSSNRTSNSVPVTVRVLPNSQNQIPRPVRDLFTVAANSLNNDLAVLGNDSDPDGDALQIISVTLPGHGGTATIINGGTMIRYTPPRNLAGGEGFEYTVSDGRGSSSSASVNMTIDATAVPSITITSPTQNQYLTSGTPFTITTTIAPTQNLTKVEFYLGRVKLGQNTNPPWENFVWNPTTDNCECGLQAKATDKYGQVGVSLPVFVNVVNPPDASLPFARIDSPAPIPYRLHGNTQFKPPVIKDGFLAVTGAVYRVQGTTTNTADYKVLVSTPDGTVLRESPWITAPQTTAFALYTNDLTTVRNGVYDLQVLVRSTNGLTNAVIRFVLESDLKIGPFSFSEQDLVIPVNGLPLMVTRTYSSLNPTIGDFGYSWTYAINDVELSLDEERINKTPLFEDDATSDDGTFSLRAGGGRNVTLTLPDGRRTTFYYYEQGGGGCGFGLCSVPRYQSAPGINATLRAVDKFGNDLNGYDALTGSWRSGGGANTAYENFDFPGWMLTMQDGTEFYIQREYKGAYEFLGGIELDEFGETFNDNFYAETYGKGKLVRIKQRSGDIIKINNDVLVNGTNHFSIDHYNASNQLTRSIFFERDAQKRISAIRDPMSGSNGLPVVKYEYDAVGNLVKVLRLVDRTAQAYQTNSYAYENTAYPHYLTTIVDGRDKPAARQLYDDQGRLIAIVDASGRTNRFDHDLAAKTETIYDREGNQTIHVYDNRGNITSTTDALGHTMLRAYDTNNYVVQETDPLNNVTRYAYDSLGNQTVVTNASGEVTRLAYNSFSQVLTALDPLGHGATNGYDAKGNLTNAVNALGQATRFLYDGQARLVSQVDAAGTFTTNVYDALGNLTTMMVKGADGASNFTSYAYDVNGNRTNEISVRRLPGGGTQSSTNSFFYDGQNRVVTTLDAEGSASRTLYNEIGQIAATVNAQGVTNLMGYDERGLLVSNLVAWGLAEQAVETHAYDGNGRRTATTDRLGRVTQFQYDAVGRMVRTIHADNTTNTTLYDEAGRVAQTIDARGGMTKFGYDAVGRRVTTTNALNQAGYSYYDAAGNLSIAADAAGRFVEYEYDVLNRRVKTLFLATIAGHARSAQTVGYDTLGRTVAQTNEAGVVTRMGYDSLGRLAAVTNAWGTADATWATYAYDEWGLQTNQVDALGRVTSFDYDKLGRRIKRILPGAQWEGFAYDAVGNLLRHTNFNGRVITNLYDAQSQLVSRWHGSTQLVVIAYNAAGQRTALSNESGVVTWAYDVRGRVRTNTTPAGTLLYAYDANGNLTNTASLTAGGVAVAYEYDVLNRLTNVIDHGLSGVKNTSYGFDEVGNLTGLRYPNNVRSEWQYDARNRLTNEVWKLNMATLASFAYQVAVAGNRTNLSEVVNGTSRNFGWSYDQQYRLTNEVAGAFGTLGYKYDIVGNRTSRTSTVSGLANQTPTYNTNDWLTTDSYDDNGNTTASGSIAYQYDWANRLTNANNGGVVVGYDGDGNRVKKTVGSTTTLYLVSTINPSGYAQVLEELTVSGGVTNLAKVYTYGLDLVCQRVLGTSTNFFGYDGHGSTRFLTDAAGNVANAFAFDAYGTLIASNASPQTAYLYCGEQFDPDLGFYYQRARYLKTDTGRFWTMDSFEGNSQDPQSLHKYLYAHGNPVNGWDPSGHNLISTLSAAAWQFTLQTINLVSRVAPVVNYRFASTIFQIQQNLWKLEVALAGLTAATIVTDAGLGWLESSLEKTLKNRQAETSLNGGVLFEKVVGATATEYESIDHVIVEPDGRKTVVSLGSRSDTQNMTDDEFLRRTEKTLIEKARRVSTQRVFEHRTDASQNIQPSQVSGRMTAVAIPETRAHLMSDPRVTAMLTRVHRTVSNVRSTIMPLRGWKPGR